MIFLKKIPPIMNTKNPLELSLVNLYLRTRVDGQKKHKMSTRIELFDAINFAINKFIAFKPYG
jgi:hypothetical protein